MEPHFCGSSFGRSEPIITQMAMEVKPTYAAPTIVALTVILASIACTRAVERVVEVTPPPVPTSVPSPTSPTLPPLPPASTTDPDLPYRALVLARLYAAVSNIRFDLENLSEDLSEDPADNIGQIPVTIHRIDLETACSAMKDIEWAQDLATDYCPSVDEILTLIDAGDFGRGALLADRLETDLVQRFLGIFDRLEVAR